jgi:hypothetical protein
VLEAQRRSPDKTTASASVIVPAATVFGSSGFDPSKESLITSVRTRAYIPCIGNQCNCERDPRKRSHQNWRVSDALAATTERARAPQYAIDRNRRHTYMLGERLSGAPSKLVDRLTAQYVAGLATQKRSDSKKRKPETLSTPQREP